MPVIVGRPTSVLIVEDERIIAKDIQQTLTGLGYDAFAIASSSTEAIARASEKCPDVVLMDIRIKGDLDGIATADILGHQFGVPVVYLTAHADEATIERAKKTAPFGYLLKPVRSMELRSAIEIAVFRHALERRLRERERWFAATLRSVTDAVVTVDLAGRITYLNPAAETLIGVRADEVLGRPAMEVISLIDRKARMPMVSPVHTVLATGEPVHVEEAEFVQHMTGETRTINESAAPVVDDGIPLGAVMVFRDVTEHKKLQRQLELSDRLASLGTLAAGVAHEINNPLTSVLMNAEFAADMLRENDDDVVGPMSLGGEPRVDRLATMHQVLQDVQGAASRIKQIVGDLRAFSQPASSIPGRVNVRECVEWAVRTTAPQLRHNIAVVTRLSPVPDILGDELRLGQVLINLLLNAGQAIGDHDGERQEILVSTSLSGTGHVTIAVHDSGIGMSRETVLRIFEPFFTTKPVGIGTGLGLSISHGIVKSFGGDIQVESTPGQGTTFRVLLPPMPQPELPGAIEGVTVASCAAPIRGRLLLIDDEEAILRVMRRVLADHDLTTLRSAREALPLLERGESFDLILSDVMMPGMTGIEFYEALLRIRPDMIPRLVFITGGVMSASVEDFLQSVPNARIEKPFSLHTLKETVQQLIAANAVLA